MEGDESLVGVLLRTLRGDDAGMVRERMDVLSEDGEGSVGGEAW